MDLFADIKNIALTELAKYGFVYSAQIERDDLLRKWFNLSTKLIQSDPRTVFESAEIRAKNLEERYRVALEFIKGKLVKGHDVNGHLSKQAMDPDYFDFLLYDWSIHHFHLSVTKQAPADFFFDRSDQLLFAIVRDDSAYLIDILPHNEKNVFAKKYLLSVVQSNWDWLLRPFELRDAIALEYNPTDEEIDKLRRAGVNMSVEINGKFYVPMGGGFTTAGTSADHQMLIVNLIQWVHHYEKEIGTHYHAILDGVNRSAGANFKNLDIKVRLHNNRFVLVEAQSGLLIS